MPTLPRNFSSHSVVKAQFVICFAIRADLVSHKSVNLKLHVYVEVHKPICFSPSGRGVLSITSLPHRPNMLKAEEKKLPVDFTSLLNSASHGDAVMIMHAITST